MQMRWRELYRDKKIVSWALYDWANSAFATTVIAGFFPIFFKNYWSADLAPSESTWLLGLSNSSASLLLAIAAPILGAMSDQSQLKKRFLYIFAGIGIVCTALLAGVPKGSYVTAAFLFTIATIGFSGSNIFYDSLIINVTKKTYFHFVSGLGYALGYLGGGILFSVNVAMTLYPTLFYLADKVSAVKVSFLMVALWWFIFTLPLAFFVDESKSSIKPKPLSLLNGWREFLTTLSNIKQHRQLLLFFVAYLFYIDGVNTTIKMAVDYGLSLGFESTHLIGALLLVQFVGFPAALAFGWLGVRFGAKPSLYFALFIYVLVIIGAYFMQSPIHFYYTAFAIGCVQGGVQSLSRSFYAQMIPVEKSGEFFGLFNMVGKFSAILGPLAVGYVSIATGSARLSILVILVFFLIGALLLSGVRENKIT